MVMMNFDARTVEPAKPFDPVPAGWYTVVITKSDQVPSASSQNASYLELELTIQEPTEFAGRKLFSRLNIENPNPATVKIAYEQLSAICHATNVIPMQETSQLHNIPFQAKASLRAAGPGADGKHYDASNEVKGYKAVSGAVNAPAAAAIPPSTAFTPPPAPVAAVVPAATPAAAPAAPPAPPAPVAAAPVAPPPAVFPPAGWTAHPEAAGFFYKDQEVLSEAQLREKMTAPAWTSAPAPAAPAATAAAQPAATPAAAPAAAAATPPWLQKTATA